MEAAHVERDAGVGTETQLGVVVHLGLGGAVDHEVRLEVEFGLVLRADEHVGHEVGLPGHLHDETDLHAGILVGAAEAVHNEEALAAELLESEVLDFFPDLLGHLVVVVRIIRGVPPHGVLGVLVHHDVLVLGGASGIDAGHYVDGAELGHLTFVIALETGLGLLVVEDFVGRVVEDLGDTFDAILG